MIFIFIPHLFWKFISEGSSCHEDFWGACTSATEITCRFNIKTIVQCPDWQTLWYANWDFYFHSGMWADQLLFIPLPLPLQWRSDSSCPVKERLKTNCDSEHRPSLLKHLRRSLRGIKNKSLGLKGLVWFLLWPQMLIRWKHVWPEDLTEASVCGQTWLQIQNY